MTQNARRVIIFEDKPDTVERMRRELTESGHAVVGTAGSIEALQILLGSGVRADIVLLDHQAPREEGGDVDDRGVGPLAEELVRKALGPEVVTVSTTSLDNPPYGDFHFMKMTRDYKFGNVGEFVTSLSNKER